MNLTQLEWIESGLKHKSYECFKPYCNSRVLNLQNCHRLLPLFIFFLPSMEERGREEERAAQGEDEVGPAGGRRGRMGREGCGHPRRGGARGRRSTGTRAPPAATATAAGEGKQRGKGAAAGKGEVRVREALHGRENEEHEETLGTTMEVLTGEEDPRRSRDEIRRLPEIWGSNRRTERAVTKPSTRRTQRYPRIPQTMHGLRVIARRSCRPSWNRPELRRAIPGARDWI
jgi:hypothetical protein